MTNKIYIPWITLLSSFCSIIYSLLKIINPIDYAISIQSPIVILLTVCIIIIYSAVAIALAFFIEIIQGF